LVSRRGAESRYKFGNENDGHTLSTGISFSTAINEVLPYKYHALTTGATHYLSTDDLLGAVEMVCCEVDYLQGLPTTRGAVFGLDLAGPCQHVL